MKKLGVLTSGGDAPGMNAAIRAVAKLAAARGIHVVGVQEGYDGLIDGRFRPLTHALSDGALTVDIELDVAGGQGGTLIGSARSARFREKDGRAAAVAQMQKHGVEGLVVIGGNGSLTGAHALATEFQQRVIGIPGSIDNDIGCTATALGVDSALNTIVEACDRIGDTARAHRRAFVVEVMGRDCGYLAMAGAVAMAADAVLIREQGKSEAQLVTDISNVIRQGFARGKRRILVLKAEGVAVPCTKLVRLTEEAMRAELPTLEIRATVLGHVVRGGNPSYSDRAVAGRLGFAAVAALLGGRSDEMVGWLSPVPGGTQTEDSSVQLFPLARVLEETKALIDGTSPVTQRRLALMARASGVLAL
ncbi:MAG: ATP-dependent 6-phosphofructokinase [Archangium sp.]|nr:ATP-dependent 6-phosphofructokinase [Archangium sp.]